MDLYPLRPSQGDVVAYTPREFSPTPRTSLWGRIVHATSPTAWKFRMNKYSLAAYVGFSGVLLLDVRSHPYRSLAMLTAATAALATDTIVRAWRHDPVVHYDCMEKMFEEINRPLMDKLAQLREDYQELQEKDAQSLYGMPLSEVYETQYKDTKGWDTGRFLKASCCAWMMYNEICEQNPDKPREHIGDFEKAYGESMTETEGRVDDEHDSSTPSEASPKNSRKISFSIDPISLEPLDPQQLLESMYPGHYYASISANGMFVLHRSLNNTVAPYTLYIATSGKEIKGSSEIIGLLLMESLSKLDFSLFKKPQPDSIQISLEEARELLGVTEGATRDEIKAAFRKKIKAAHPDKMDQAEESASEQSESERVTALMKAREMLLKSL